MKLEEITSSKPDYSWLLLGLIALTCACLLSCCASKKKALNLQKSEQSQQSDVKKETKDSTSDKSHGYYIHREAKSDDYSEVIEESADSTKIDKEGNTTVYSPKKKQTRTGSKKSDHKSAELKQNDVKSASSLKLDSAGKSHVKEKSKIQAKEITDNLTGKALAISLLLVCVVAALAYIRWQWRKKKIIGL